jgi:hypothetical protein
MARVYGCCRERDGVAMDDDTLLEDLFKQQTSAAIYDEVNAKPVIMSGRYEAAIIYCKVLDYHEKSRFAGHKHLRLGLALYDAEGTKKGTKYCSATWEEFRKRGGKLERDSKLFNQLKAALGMKKDCTIGEIMEVAPGGFVGVFGKEYFVVPMHDIPECCEVEEDRDNKWIFVEADEDDLRDQLLDKGYESDLMILAIYRPSGT